MIIIIISSSSSSIVIIIISSSSIGIMLIMIISFLIINVNIFNVVDIDNYVNHHHNQGAQPQDAYQ